MLPLMTSVAIESTFAETVPPLAAAPALPAPATMSVSPMTAVLRSARFTRSPFGRVSGSSPTFGKQTQRSPKRADLTWIRRSANGSDRPAEHERARLHRGGIEDLDLITRLRVPEVHALGSRLVENQQAATVELDGDAALPRPRTLDRLEGALRRIGPDRQIARAPVTELRD